MKRKLPTMSRIARALVLAGLCTAALPAMAAEYWLAAKALEANMPNGASLPMWGFAACAPGFETCAAATVPGPVLEVPAGEGLTIHLFNNLPSEPVSIVIPGQTTTMTPVKFTRPGDARPRVRSFTHEAAPGAISDYVWTDIRPGTYLYHSGTHPQVQVQMGLYGGIKKDVGPGEAYAGVLYDNELTLLWSEIDPALHKAVANGTYGTAAGPTSTLDFKPKYFLINGRPFSVDTATMLPLTAGARTLMRLLNAGIQTYVPVIDGAYLDMIAEDGNPYPWPASPRQQYSVLLPAAKTVDAVLTPQAGAGGEAPRHHLFDRRLNLSNPSQANGGMQIVLAAGAPSITSAAVTTATQDAPYVYDLTATDPDGTALIFELLKGPAGMTLTPAADGGGAQLAWTPTAADVFSWQAVSVRATDASGLYATQNFDIRVRDINQPPVNAADAYTMIKGGTLTVRARGVLANDSDPNPQDVLTSVNFSALAGADAAAVLVPGLDGSFSFTPGAGFVGANSFTYQARDDRGVLSALPATVSLNVIPNRAPVAVADAAVAPVRTVVRSAYTWVVIPVLANDHDPDTAIDPNNRMDPATVAIFSAPSAGGFVEVNPDGTISYMPLRNFTGTETFTYTVADNYHNPGAPNPAGPGNNPRTSNPATVTVTVR